MQEEYINLNLSALLKIINENKRIFLITSLLSLSALFVYNQYKADEYISITKILPEVNHKATNGLAGLFETAKTMSNGKELYNLEITPSSLYTDILYSKEFHEYLKSKNIDLEKENLEKQIQIITKKQKAHILKAHASTPENAIEINNAALDFLLKYINTYRTQKATGDLQFIENLNFNDSKTKENLILQQKLIIQDQTPYFKILNKNEVSKVPKHSEMKYILAVFLCLIFSLIYALIKDKNFLKVIEKK